MTKVANWPFWLQMLVLLPHGVLLLVLVWFWWPKSGRDLLRWFACFVYLLVFYFVFVR